MAKRGPFSPRPPVRRAWGGRLRDLAIVVMATLTTGAVSLVLEDALPTQGDPVFQRCRWLAVLLTTGVLSVLVWRRQRTARLTGTLYYLRYLAEWMPDWRLEQLEVLQDGYLDQRFITRWFVQGTQSAAVDIADDVADLTQELQRAMNDDDVSTGFSLAPNLLLPAGVALGYDLYRRDELTLEELFPGKVSLSWTLHEAAPGGAGFATLETRSAEVDPDGPSVLVTADLTGTGPTTRPPWTFHHHYRVAAFPAGAHGLTSPAHPVTVSTRPPRRQAGASVNVSQSGTADARPGSGAAEQTPPRDHTTDHDLAPVLVHPWTATEEITRAIRRALHNHPTSPVVVAMRVPKTVAVGVGWWLANGQAGQDPGCGHDGCLQPPCRHPWRHLAIALLDQESPTVGSYVLTRVHRGQPDVDTLRGRILAGAS